VNTQTNVSITESAKINKHFTLCLHWSGCSQYRFIYLGTFCYACVGLGVHNTDLFILALSVRLVLVWVFTIQIYLSWHFMLGLCWSGCSQYRFIYLGTFCYVCVGMDVVHFLRIDLWYINISLYNKHTLTCI
jgi:hypothetical protein